MTGFTVTKNPTETVTGADKTYSFRLARLNTAAKPSDASSYITTVTQIQHGDLYLDLPVEPIIYNGPFKVEVDPSDNTIRVKQFETLDNTPLSGNVIYTNDAYLDTENTLENTVFNVQGPVNVNVSGTSAYIYAYIQLNKNGVTQTSQLYRVEHVDFGTSYDPSVHGETYVPDKIYSVRIAKILSSESGYEIAQVQYGDIYLGNVSDPLPYEDRYSEYEGPFKVIGATAVSNAYVTVKNFDTASATGMIAPGHVVKDGNDIKPFEILAANGTISISYDNSPEDIYAHVLLSKGSIIGNFQTYSIQGCTITKTSTIAASADKIYSYRLARVATQQNGTGTAATYTTTVIQVQHGDLYLGDTRDPLDYNGPFKIVGSTATQTVTPATFEIIGHTNYVGNIIYANGSTVNTFNVENKGAISVTNGAQYVYLYIQMTKSEETEISKIFTIDYADITTDTAAPSHGNSYTPEKIYTIRLAEAGTCAYGNLIGTTVTQIQYGDIVLGDISEPKKQENGDTYNGPFKVAKDGSISCPVCLSAQGEETWYGHYIISGKTEEKVWSSANKVTTVQAGSTATDIYFNLKVSATGAKAEITTERATGDNDYSVWLAQVNGTTATQIHYGDIYIDGRWS